MDRGTADGAAGGGGDGWWLTWADAARALGMKPESVQRRAQKARWARMTGNDGRARVAVPAGLLPPGWSPDALAEGAAPERPRDGLAALLAAAVAPVAEALRASEARAAAAEADLAALRERTAEPVRFRADKAPPPGYAVVRLPGGAFHWRRDRDGLLSPPYAKPERAKNGADVAARRERRG